MKEGTLRTYHELMKEDFYQMKKTINAMAKKSDHRLLTLVLDTMNNKFIETVEQFRLEILRDN